MSDHHLIADLTGLDRAELQRRLMHLGDEAAEHLEARLASALEAHEEVILLTHVPPFREACWYQGRTTDDNWAPFFTCQAVGDLLYKAMRERPDRRLTVLCGHTHSAGRAEILPNLLVLTGQADYGAPQLQRLMDIV
jgi:3',5'-cyclic-AMP phosphodiesterase